MQLHLFFFQAEDGIRGLYVTGVQTCALPISVRLAEFNGTVSTAVARLEPVRARVEGSWLPDGVEVEFAHLSDPEARSWLADLIRHGTPQPASARRLQALRLATEIDVFETYLQTQFLGQKTLSVQGLES